MSKAWRHQKFPWPRPLKLQVEQVKREERKRQRWVPRVPGEGRDQVAACTRQPWEAERYIEYSCLGGQHVRSWSQWPRQRRNMEVADVVQQPPLPGRKQSHRAWSLPLPPSSQSSPPPILSELVTLYPPRASRGPRRSCSSVKLHSRISTALRVDAYSC